MKTHYFCIAHKNIVFDIPSETKVICTGNFNLDSQYNIINSTKNLYSTYKRLAGTAGSFYINELLNNVKDDDYVNIFSYRKFVSKNPLALEQMQIEISKKTIENNNIKTIDEIKNINTEYLFCHPMYLQSIVSQYNDKHIAQDLFRFLSCALDLNIINKNEIIDFLNYSILIPGGIEIGKFPVYVYKKIVSQLEIVTNLFLQTHNTSSAKDEYQSRAISFCCERLSSWLLIKHLEEKFNQNFIKSGNFISWKENQLIDDHTINFNDFFGYLHLVN